MARSAAIATSAFTGTNGATPTDFTALNPADGSIVIDTNRIESNVSSQTLDARWTGSGTFSDDQYAKLTVTGLSNPGGLNQMGVILRASADTEGSRDCYRVFVRENNTTEIRIEKIVNGTTTVLNTTNVSAFANGDTVEGEVEGTTIRSYRNGTLVASVTDSALTTGKPGITARLEFGPGLFGDNWEAGDMTAASSGGLIVPGGRSAMRGGMQGLTGGMARAMHQFHERLLGRRIFLMGA